MEDRKQEIVTNENINFQADNLNDLPVTDEQADETKGGGTSLPSAGENPPKMMLIRHTSAG